jgi:hypothetical protein
MTLLETLIVTVLLSAFVIGGNAIWAALNRHLQVLANRASVNREMRAARALILSDMAAASSLAVGQPGVLSLHYSNPALPTVTYSFSQGTLVRTVAAGNQAISAAQYLKSANCALAEDGSLSASWNFQKGTASATLKIFQVFVNRS